MARTLLALAAVVLLAAGCGEEERRAGVSILPAGDAKETASSGPLQVSADGRAVLLGRDTLFTANGLPDGPDDVIVEPIRFHRLAFSPDSTLVAFTTAGANQAVGIWSRTAQTARFVDVFPGGRADSLAWSPDGRWLAWSGRTSDGTFGVAVSDPAGRRLRHPVVEWLLRQGRSVGLEGWIDPGRLRVLVTGGPRAAEGPAYVWDTRGNHFTFEDHIEPMVERAPGAPPVPGGVFSLDLVGDAVPETVALFRSGDGAPASVLLESRGGDYRTRVTDPLIEPADLGLESWEAGSGRIGLYAPVRFASGTALLLELPSMQPGVAAIGVFDIGVGGSLEPFLAATPEGDRPAIFFDGRIGEESYQLGLVDLDGDATAEVVGAVGRMEGGQGGPAVRWTATVFRERAGRLVPTPELESAALERIAEATAR
ncbi:MAG: TolB family protein [Gemmatimonadota bacterium]